MKKYFILFLTIFMCLFVFAGCGPKETSYEIALVTDVGNIDDKSFNQGAWEGVKAYAEENNKTYAYYRPAADTKDDRIAMINSAISKGAKIVVCPGFLFEEAIYDVQELNPDVAFLILDGEPHDKDYKYKTASNVHCILYQEEQAGYLAGYAAVKDGYKNLGFLGGMDVPAVIRFGYGFVQGAEKAAIEDNVDGVSIKYGYTMGFSPSDDIKTKMTAWYSSGTEIVFSCGGGIYLSVLAAAQEGTNKKMIGVDSDQSSISELILTSAMKDLTQSVKLALDSFYKAGGKWDDVHAGKTAKLGAAEGCIGLPKGDSWRFAKFTTEKYDEVFAEIVSKTRTISAATDAAPAVTKVTVDYNAYK